MFALRLTSATIAGHALVRHPKALWRQTCLPEHVDWNSPPRIPVSTDSKPFCACGFDDPLADHHRTVFMKSAVIAEGSQEQFERLGLYDFVFWHVVDHQVREIRLAGHGAQARELGASEADQIVGAGMRAGHCLKHCGLRRRGYVRQAPELRQRFSLISHRFVPLWANNWAVTLPSLHAHDRSSP